jgi:hypothetical protein
VFERAREEGIVESAWMNIALTGAGLRTIGAPGLDAFPTDFLGGMAAQASALGDVDSSAPPTWRPPFSTPSSVHALVIIAADSHEDIDARHAHLQTLIVAHGIQELDHQDGDVRPDTNRGHEHFGFKDGISQPGIRGITTSSKAGEPPIAAGEFLIGYPDEAGDISGRPPAAPPQPPVQPGYDPNPTPPLAPLPDWAHNGSFLVYRRLRQDVGAFRAFLDQTAATVGLSSEQLAAKLVGRWPSGAPMEHVPGLPHAVDAAAADPSPEHPQVLNDGKINNFDYLPADEDAMPSRVLRTSARAIRAAPTRTAACPTRVATASSAAVRPTVPSSHRARRRTREHRCPLTVTAACCSCVIKRRSPAASPSSSRHGSTRRTSRSPETATTRSSPKRSNHEPSRSRERPRI